MASVVSPHTTFSVSAARLSGLLIGTELADAARRHAGDE